MRNLIISLSIAIACAVAPDALAQEKNLAADYAKMLRYLDAAAGESLVLEGDRFVPLRQAELRKLAQKLRAHAEKHGLVVKDIDFVAESYPAAQGEEEARRSFEDAHGRAAEMLQGYKEQHEASEYTRMIPVVSAEGIFAGR